MSIIKSDDFGGSFKYKSERYRALFLRTLFDMDYEIFRKFVIFEGEISFEKIKEHLFSDRRVSAFGYDVISFCNTFNFKEIDKSFNDFYNTIYNTGISSLEFYQTSYLLFKDLYKKLKSMSHEELSAKYTIRKL